MQERQEFLDRYMVFSGTDWQPPRDWSRTNGLVEDVRKAYAEIAEQARLEAESRPREMPPREPSDPIELPGDVSGVGSAAPSGTTQTRRLKTPTGGVAPLVAPMTAPRTGPGPAPALAPAPAPPPPPPPPQGDNEPAFRINPIARSVNVDRAE